MRELKARSRAASRRRPRTCASSRRATAVISCPSVVRENRAVRLDDDGELHVGEALEEKLALADRFGLVLGFYGFDQRTYLRIVERYATQAGSSWPRERPRAEALRFASNRSSRSGRVARQFVDDLAGRIALDRANDS